MGKKKARSFLDPITGIKVTSGKVYSRDSDVLAGHIIEAQSVSYELSSRAYVVNIVYDQPELGDFYQRRVYEGKFKVGKRGAVSGSLSREYLGQYSRVGGRSDLPPQEKYYIETLSVDTLGQPAAFGGKGDFIQATNQFALNAGVDYSYGPEGGYFTDNSGAVVPRATDKGQFSSFGASRFFGDNWWVDMF